MKQCLRICKHTYVSTDVYVTVFLRGWRSGLPWWLKTVKHLPAMQETQDRFPGWEIPWRRKWRPTPVLLPGESHGRRSLVGYSPWSCKESDRTEGLRFPKRMENGSVMKLAKEISDTFCSCGNTWNI